jgi:hypothetical protein
MTAQDSRAHCFGVKPISLEPNSLKIGRYHSFPSVASRVGTDFETANDQQALTEENEDGQIHRSRSGPDVQSGTMEL